MKRNTKIKRASNIRILDIAGYKHHITPVYAEALIDRGLLVECDEHDLHLDSDHQPWTFDDVVLLLQAVAPIMH